MAQDRTPVTVMLHPDQLAQIEELLKTRPGRTVADSLEELLVDPIIRSYFLEKIAPADCYTIPKAVSDEEIAAVQDEAAPMIEKLLAGHLADEILGHLQKKAAAAEIQWLQQ